MKNNQIISVISELEEKGLELFSNLPESIIAGNMTYIESKANIFINDTEVDSFGFLNRLRVRPITRYIEIWEQDYLTQKLAETLVGNISDLSERVVVPLNGCGEMVAENLVQKLEDRFGMKLQIVDANQSINQKVLVVDDVIKTGNTILNNVIEEIISSPETVYATWAMSALRSRDLNQIQYRSLKMLVSKGQRIVAGVVYAGNGISSPGLGLPLNSISTLLQNNRKAQEVLRSLSTKYFGDNIYKALELEC